MRSFPRAARRRVATAALLVAAVGGSTLVPTLSGDLTAYADSKSDLERQQAQIEQKIKDAGVALEDSSARVTKASAALTAAQARVVTAKSALDTARKDLSVAERRVRDAEAKDRRMQRALDRAEAKLASARADLNQGEAAVDDQQRQMVDSVLASVQGAPTDLDQLQSIISAGSAVDLTIAEQVDDLVADVQSRGYQDLAATQVVLTVRKVNVADAKGQVAAQRLAAAEHLVVMEQLRVDAVRAKRAVRASVLQAQAARADAESAARRALAAKRQDLEVIEQLKAEEEAVKDKIRALAATSANQTISSTDAMLARPVNGYITSPYGYRIHPIYGYRALHDGIDFGAACGTQLWASRSGTVIEKYLSSSFGNRVLINLGNINGHNYVIGYNHMASASPLAVGQRVARGDLVGYVGTTGWSTGCHLHFQVYRDGTTVDPMTYL
ncbi:hypothetical protein BH09ACT11_BH09ACT11_22340 [soil metagenome]